MKLFEHLGVDAGRTIVEHEDSGRFLPLTQIISAEDLTHAISSLIPLLHAPPEVADPIKYVFSEIVRNVLEHSRSPIGAFVCAQYYQRSKKISIGVADCGIGILGHMRQHHNVSNSRDAILLALQPGITGTTNRPGGTPYNAGAGLFFTKSISLLSRNYFMVYSGDAIFRLNRTKQRDAVHLHADPLFDPNRMYTAPFWPGTVVGIDLNIEQNVRFSDLMSQIRSAYRVDVKKKKDYSAKIRFS